MKKLLRYSFITYLVYLALALVVVTPLLNILPHSYLREHYGRELTTKFVWFNPFTLSLEVREAALPEKSGEPFVALGAASINFSVASAWQEGIVFDRVRLLEFFAHIQHLGEQRFNFSDFIPDAPAGQAPTPQTPPADPIGITVNDLDLQASAIQVTDHDRAQAFTTRWENLHVHAVDFSTVLREGKPYRIALADEAGGTLLWEGTVSIANAQSEGRLTLDAIRLEPFWRFAEPWVRFQLREGLLHASGRYAATWGDSVAVSLADGALSVSALDIAPKAGITLPDTALALGSLSVQGVALDTAAQHASVEQVIVDGVGVDGFSEGTRVSLQELFTPDLPQQEAQDTTDAAGSDWTGSLGRLEVRQGRVSWQSGFTDPPILDVAGINAKVEQLEWPLAGETRLAVDLSVNDTASVTTQGVIALDSGTGQFDYSLAALQLPWFNPALPPEFRARLTGGEVATRGGVTLVDYAPATIQLDASITAFGMRQEDAQQQFTGWDTLQLDRLQLDFSQRSVVLNKLTLDALQGRVHIAQDGTLNTTNLWQPAAPADPAPQAGEQLVADSPDTDNTEASDPPAESAWAIRIPTVQLKKAAIDFQDDSLPIDFRTLIGDLNGFIEGLDSNGQASAKVDIKGSVDGYAPVSLSGSLNPLRSPPVLDLKLTFDGVDLARVSPYSGTYAGYAIDRGLLDLDLAYTLNDNKLVGKNNIVIDQLKLGEKVTSDKALDIPLKLGISLLTNASGVIDMKVPVSGNLDDPSFKLSSVIASAFVNLITKAVTAPFSLLANLVSSDEDLQFITFAPGESALEPASAEKLGQLAQALAQRPALALAIVGRVHPEEDRQALQADALEAALLAQGLTRDSIDNRDEAWVKAVSERTGATAGADGAPPANQELLRLALAGFPVDDTQLLALAEARATAVKTFLVNDAALAADRAVIEKAALEDQKRDFNGVELLLEN